MSDRRTRLDFAACVEQLIDVHYPGAETVVLVLDRPNTHSPAALSAAFPSAEAQRLADKLDLHPTPKHGSWPNMAELELSVLQRQCLRQRLGDREAMDRAVAAWADRRNAAIARVDWQFTAADARTTPRRLYPAYHA